MNLGVLILIIGLLAFIVSCVVQAIKGVALFKKVPTDLVVFILSIAFTLITYFAYASYANVKIVWYMVVATLICGFIVALVAMNGWEKVSELFKRFVSSAPKDLDNTSEQFRASLGDKNSKS